MRISRIIIVLAGVLLTLQSFSTLAKAETRRAFLVGIQRYSDGYIPPLKLSVNDAKDVGKDLEEVGFDKKNIKVVTDLKNRDAFEKEFSAFLKTIEKGDTVIFFYSGHGFGIEADQTNYLLFGDLRSPYTFTKGQLNEQDRKNDAVVRLRIPQYLDQYQRDEIPNGISTTEIQRRLAEKNPGVVFMILDACRTIVNTPSVDDTPEVKALKRGKESGSRLINVRKPPPGFLILYSASFGEQAIEGISGPNGGDRNSLFTSVLRAEMMRPGMPITDLGERVRRVVRATADNARENQQEPEVFYDSENPAAAEKVESFYLIGSIGRERFHIADDRCKGDNEDWEHIEPLRRRELYERHRQRFDSCPGGTAEKARRAIALMGLGSEELVTVAAAPSNRVVNECDSLAASRLDYRRPPEVPGVEKVKDFDAAIAACNKAIEDNPRITRFLFNLGRTYHQLSLQPGLDDAVRTNAMERARLNYEDASKRGYEVALNNLAVIEDFDKHYERAIDLFKRAAEAQQPLAMYNLGIRYRDGTNVLRDWEQAKEWLARAAEKNFVPAMTAYGQMLALSNNSRGREWLERAANLGSRGAKYLLGYDYYFGKGGVQDLDLALLWFGRVAETNNTAEALLAVMMESGEGLPAKEPDSAASYWRLAANGGSQFAEVEFANRLRQGVHLVKEEYGEGEIIALLERAKSQGSVQAAVTLAQIYRDGENGVAKDPIKAMRLAYEAIDLAVQANPTDWDYNPFYEINAAHLLEEMARNGEAVNARGQPLLTQDEIDRIERYYGKINPGSSKVTIRRLLVPINCGYFESKKKFHRLWTMDRQPIWIWDWGRSEAPTEMQIRDIERKNRFCTGNDELRATLSDIFEQSKKSKVAFADLVYEKISVLQGVADAPDKKGKRPHGRHR